MPKKRAPLEHKRAPLEHKKAPILISYRLEGKHRGKASYYDHHTMQHHTAYPTVALMHEAPENNLEQLKNYIKEQTTRLPQSPVDRILLKPVPSTLKGIPDTGGLLFIPGMTRDSYETQPQSHRVRMHFEKRLIKDALNRGRPIVGVCAGSWTLWQTAWEWTGRQAQDATIAVTDHNYGGGMPRINAQGKMTHNKLVHNAHVEQGSLLQQAMGLGDTLGARTFPVNSIHWRAPDPTKTPCNFIVVATAQDNPQIRISTRQQTTMAPTVGSVEAFESRRGAPVLGIGWHPEAFDWTSASLAHSQQRKCLLFMAKAGDTFTAKQRMNKEFASTQKAVNKSKADGELADVFQKLKI